MGNRGQRWKVGSVVQQKIFLFFTRVKEPKEKSIHRGRELGKREGRDKEGEKER